MNAVTSTHARLGYHLHALGLMDRFCTDLERPLSFRTHSQPIHLSRWKSPEIISAIGYYVIDEPVPAEGRGRRIFVTIKALIQYEVRTAGNYFKGKLIVTIHS